ncbi:methyl-accepting chemotaxis sensory transducer [Bacillus methanolicus PB1]|uniref:Methyl-accepting chemotaxis sensory transducer n=1 Tax=Bacillus methanolicus PB1 TaxID=997296 RepID=I3E5K0_BACMT|nr:HAMP domain-containing methyl-accepting chemotaxis protein [Bacillus methanolicus]EIJ81771.1 methyl-accepting chemotaxis sensory transducer [Bacillus methanolicus PB1]
MLKNMNFFTKNMLFSIVSVVIVGVALIGMGYIIQGNLLENQLKQQSEEITRSWMKKIDADKVKKAYKTEDIKSKEHQELTALLDQLSEYNPNIAQGYIFGTELAGKNGNETSIVANSTKIWEVLRESGLKVGDMYAQPDVVVEAIKNLKKEKKVQFTKIYKDDLGTWMTILHPIINSKGEVFAYFGVDIDASNIAEGQKDLLFNSGISLIVILMLLIAVQYFLLKISLKPLTNLMQGIEEASKGNLNISVKEGKDELGQVNQKFNGMINVIKGTVSRIRHTSKEIAENSERLYASFETSYKAAYNITNSVETVQKLLERQAKSINESSVSVEQISKEIISIANNTNEVYELSEGVTKLSDIGKTSTDKVAEQMEKINLNVENSDKAINELVIVSDEIQEILQVITNISNNTNLLALNASIEAARAGEQGKGFAVVANEVKKLSEQSANSVENIQKLIDKVKEQVNKVVDSMEIIKNDVSEGIEITVSTNEVFGKIYDSILEVANKLQVVSSSSQQISAGVEESSAMIIELSSNAENITKRYDDIVENIQEQESSFENIKETVSYLTETSKELKKLSDQFNI